MELKYVLLSNILFLCLIRLTLQDRPDEIIKQMREKNRTPVEDLLGAQMVKNIIDEYLRGSRWMRCSNFIMEVFANRKMTFSKLHTGFRRRHDYKWALEYYRDEIEQLTLWTKVISKAQSVYARHFCQTPTRRQNIGNSFGCLYCANRMYGENYVRLGTVARTGVIGYNSGLDRAERERREKYPNPVSETILEKCKPYHFLQFSTCEGILATLRFSGCQALRALEESTNKSLILASYFNANPECCDGILEFHKFRSDLIFNACHFGDYSKIAKCFKGGKQFLDMIREAEFEYNICRYEKQYN